MITSAFKRLSSTNTVRLYVFQYRLCGTSIYRSTFKQICREAAYLWTQLSIGDTNIS